MADLNLNTGNQPAKPDAKAEFTVREMIARLANCEDMDAIVSGSFCNSDPMPITDVTDDEGEGTITLKLG